MFAARVGDLASAKLLVAAGANVNDADAWGVSATALAAHSGFGELVEFLLEKGADPNAAAAGFTALHEAIMRRDEAMVSALLAHGADAERSASRPGRRPAARPTTSTSRPSWSARRRSGWPRASPSPASCACWSKHGADPLFVHHGDQVVEGRAARRSSTGPTSRPR